MSDYMTSGHNKVSSAPSVPHLQVLAVTQLLRQLLQPVAVQPQALEVVQLAHLLGELCQLIVIQPPAAGQVNNCLEMPGNRQVP